MNTDWKSYAELIGLAAVVASLVFVGLELRQSQEIARAEMHAGNLANIIEVRNARIANADIWIRGNANEALTPIEEESLAKYRGAIEPGESLTSDWVTRVESAIAAIEREAQGAK